MLEGGARREDGDLLYARFNLIVVTLSESELAEDPEVLGEIFIWI
jgi:hypothetical protein